MEAVEARKRRSKNWNLFAGDLEYKTDFFLRFYSGFTATRYLKDRFQRFFYASRTFTVFTAVYWTFLYFHTGLFTLLPYLLGFGCVIFCYRSISIQFVPWRARIPLLFIEFFTQFALTHYGQSLFLILFDLPTLVANLVFALEWHQHALISLAELGIRTAIFGGKPCHSILYPLLSITITTAVFGYVEKSMKEDWVLYDSFKKSQNVILKFADASPFPSFVLDFTGKIMKCNKTGEEMLKCGVSKKGGFGALVQASQRELVMSLAKRSIKEGICRIEALLLVNAVPAENYEPYNLTIEGLAWKGTKCAVITCENIKAFKESHKTVMNSELGVQSRLQGLCGKLEEILLSSSSSGAERTVHRKFYYETKQLLYQNEHSLLATTRCLEGFVRDLETFDITEYLNYVMELHNVYASEKGVLLTLKLEPGFPKQVTGERLKFELLLSAFLNYLITHTEKDKEIQLEAKLKNPIEEGLLLRFEFSAPLSAGINMQLLESELDTILLSPAAKGPGKLDFKLLQSREMLQWMKGSIEVVSLSAQTFGMNVDAQFASYDNASPVCVRKPLKLFEAKMINKYTTRWVEICPLPTEESKVSPAQAGSNRRTAELKDKIMRAVREGREKANREKLSELTKDEIKNKILNRTLQKKSQSSLVDHIIESGGLVKAAVNRTPPQATDGSKAGSNADSQDYINAISPSAVLVGNVEVQRESSPHLELNVDQLEFEMDEAYGFKSPESCKSAAVDKRPHAARLNEYPEVLVASKAKMQKLAPVRNNSSSQEIFYHTSPNHKPRPMSMTAQSSPKKLFSGHTHLHNHKRQPSFTVSTRAYQGQIMSAKVKRRAWSKDKKADLSEDKRPGETAAKVLIVEDNSFNIVPITATLTKNAVPFDIAKNGLMAVERYEAIMKEGLGYCVILMDLEMPIMDGYEATQTIRKVEKSQRYVHTHICGLSAYNDKSVEERCLQNGMDQFVSKPLDMEYLMRLIRELLEKRGRK